MIVFLDASALVKRYVEEEESSAVESLTTDEPVAVSRLSEVEVASAFARRTRGGDLATDVRDDLTSELMKDLEELYVVEIVPSVTAMARALLVRHPLRASDAIQLASALTLGERAATVVRFVAFDQRLTDAARAEGLETGVSTRSR